ncbi:MAG: DUF6084 family protein [Actinomycetota bacterium]|nr:DUF6084 family protein [Actinomycetota bacterium]
MSDLDFEVLGVAPDPYAAAPTLLFKLRIAETSGVAVHSVALRCQLRIEPQRRRYTPVEEERLLAIFGETPRWGDTLKPFLWTHASTMVAGFSDATEVDLPVPCTYDFEVAAAKYLHALDDGEIPLVLLFNGTVFSSSGVEPVPWHKETHFKMPAQVWRQLMDLYFPNSGWVRLHRDTLDDLERFKASRALPTWEQAIEVLLKEADG